MKTKKIKKSIAIFSFVFSLFFSFGFFFFANADENKSIISFSSGIKIENAKIIEQKNNILEISFDLNNETDAQPDVFYAVELLEEKSKISIEKIVFDGKIAIDSNFILHEKIGYSVPEYLSGNYEVILSAGNSKGMTFSSVSVGKISQKGNSDYVEIKKESCFLKVEGEGEEKKYNLFQGVDILPEEKLMISCDIINHSQNKIELKTGFETYYRSVFGKNVSSDMGDSIFLESKEQKKIVATLPKVKIPQAYDTRFFLVNSEGKLFSNNVIAHYVLKGKSATVHNINLDKMNYKKGEIAILNATWTPSADIFPGSRKEGTRIGDALLSVKMLDYKGKQCASPISFKISDEEFVFNQTENLTISNDCFGPDLFYELKDNKGDILDSGVFAFNDKKTGDNEKIGLMGEGSKEDGAKSNKEKYLPFLVIFFLMLISLAIIFIHKKIKKRNLKNSDKLFIFMIFIFGFYCFSSFGAKADFEAPNLTSPSDGAFDNKPTFKWERPDGFVPGSSDEKNSWYEIKVKTGSGIVTEKRIVEREEYLSSRSYMGASGTSTYFWDVSANEGTKERVTGCFYTDYNTGNDMVCSEYSSRRVFSGSGFFGRNESREYFCNDSNQQCRPGTRDLYTPSISKTSATRSFQVGGAQSRNYYGYNVVVGYTVNIDKKVYNVGGEINAMINSLVVGCNNGGAFISAGWKITQRDNPNNIVEAYRGITNWFGYYEARRNAPSVSGLYDVIITVSGVNHIFPIEVVSSDGFALTIRKQGTGSGRVISNVAGIDCGDDCFEIYSSGTQVTLTAQPSEGSSFAGFTGGGCTGQSECMVTMDASKTINANFSSDFPTPPTDPTPSNNGNWKEVQP